jgi:hypothetical protein
VKRVGEAFPEVKILSFHDDDHFIIGDPREALSAFDRLVKELEKIGRQVNSRKLAESAQHEVE